jgi:hypothetical protein
VVDTLQPRSWALPGDTIMKKQKFDTLSTPMGQHFFASSVAEWRTGVDPEQLIKDMQKGGYPFRVWLIPVDLEDHYEIKFYVPSVPGALLVASYGFDKYLEV